MDKIVLNNGTSLDVETIVTSTNGLILTFTNQTIDGLETLMTKSNLSILKIAKEDGTVVSTFNNLSCLSIALMIESGNVVATLYQENDMEERVSTLESQNAEMLFALVMGGLM